MSEAKVYEFSQHPFLKELGLQEQGNFGCFNGEWFGNGNIITSYNPSTGNPIATIIGATKEDYEKCIESTIKAQKEWKSIPAPQRGEILRQFGDECRRLKEPLGKLISLEMGKILPEGLGEVQEVIDICDYAVGLSRMINGSVLPSERKDHVLMEVWNPLGTIGIITAFNFPMAVFGWNAAISLVCGNTQIWKGASTTSLCTIALTKVLESVLRKNGVNPAVSSTILGPGSTIGDLLVNDKRISLISFTGSTEIGRGVSTKVHSRFGRTILELGGNNAIIVMDDADLDLVIPATFFAAVGTCGQRCTTCRRLIVHEKVYDEVVNRLKKAYAQLKIGNPLEEGVLCGPLHTESSVKTFVEGIKTIQEQGGKILCGGKQIKGNFVEPTMVEIDRSAPIIKEELFVPILYVIKAKDLDDAIEINNSVPQGLSSSLFTNNQKSVFKWIGPEGSDCGIINVNAPSNGAEIGGAFGGEKETGGGRESGSDSWKQYMRRGTVTINYGKDLPLAQGIKFE